MITEPIQFGETINNPLERVSVYGVILNDEGKILVVDVNETFHLPGGGIDDSEEEKAALERETLEETGYSISGIKLIGKANQYLPKASLGPMNKLGTFYSAVAGSQDSSRRVEVDHEPGWMSFDEIMKAPMAEFQKWAIDQVFERDLRGYIGKTVTVVMDRQLGTKHPRYDFIYPINYGYLPNTVSGDGKEIDAYVLGIDVPLEEFEGTCIAVIHRLNDNKDKLVVVLEGKTMTDDQIMESVEFQEKWFNSSVLR